MARCWRCCTLPTDEYEYAPARLCVYAARIFFLVCLFRFSHLDGYPHRWQRGVHQANRCSPSTVHAGRRVPGVGAAARRDLGLLGRNSGEVLARVPQ